MLQQVGCPLEAIHSPTPSPEELLHLTTAERERIRTVPSLQIPCEQTMIKCKQLLATSHATETGTFANGAYVTDPIRFVSVLCAQSPLLVVGGDTGDQLTKLGVTYLDEKQTQQFAALLVYRGKDDYTDLDTLKEPSLTPFTGDSSAFPHIFAVLQHFIDDNKVRLQGMQTRPYARLQQDCMRTYVYDVVLVAEHIRLLVPSGAGRVCVALRFV